MKGQKGFTLVEVLVAGFIVVILGLGIITLQKAFTDNQINTWRNFTSVDDANRAAFELTRELRTARPSDTGSYTLEVTGDQEIVFYCDVDFDGQTERVHYYLNGTELYKAVTQPSGYPLVEYLPEDETTKLITDTVRNGATPIFYYYNGDWPNDTAGNPLGVSDRIADTRLIQIYVRMNSQESDPEGDYILESYSQLRMLKDNI